jgi:hypothetical protein
MIIIGMLWGSYLLLISTFLVGNGFTSESLYRKLDASKKQVIWDFVVPFGLVFRVIFALFKHVWDNFKELR